MFTIIKVFIILFLLCLWENPGNFQNKFLRSIEYPGTFSFWLNWRGEEGLLWRVEEIVTLLPRALGCQKRWKSLSFCDIWIILLLFCCILDPLQKSTAGMNSMINLWIDSWTCQNYRILLLARQRSNKLIRAFKRKCIGEYDAVTLTIFYLKVLPDIVSRNC